MIHVVTDPGVGGTFLSWSIHWLAGHTDYFLVEENKHCKLTENPVGKNNAHAFVPNQPNRIFNCSPEQFDHFVNYLNNNGFDDTNILYYHWFSNPTTTEHAIKYSNANATKLIVIDSSQDLLYHCTFRKRAPYPVDHQKILFDDQEIQNFFITTFFNDSKEQWELLKLTDKWDLREFLALNLRPFDPICVYTHVDKSKEHYLLPGRILWSAMDEEIQNLFEYLNLKLDQHRFEHWKEIYRNWKRVHYQRLRFSTHFDTIISSIINNWNFDLTTFDLDIQQEAAIQHALIYRHNLNLKTWQLEKFVNCQQLHNLLETNIHPL